MAKQEVSRIIRKLYVEVTQTNKGKTTTSLVEVKRISSPDQYMDDVLVYENKLSKGSKAGQSEYFVSCDDYVPAKRASAKEVQSAMLADMQAGMTIEQLQAKYNIQ